MSDDERGSEGHSLFGRGEQVPLLAPARRVLRVLAALDGDEVPTAVAAAHAGMTSAVARRHLKHLARIGLARPGQAEPDTYRITSGLLGVRPATLTRAGTARAITWHLGCVYEAARVLGAAALPGSEQIHPDPQRPPLVPADAPAALAWFARTRQKLTDALASASTLRVDAAAWRLGLLMLNLGCFAGVWEGWRKVYELSLRAAWCEQEALAAAHIEEFAGKLELTCGNPAAARTHHQVSLEIRSTAGDAAAVARSLNALGVSFLREMALPEAKALFLHALEIAVEARDQEFACFARMNIAAVDARAGHAEEALEQLEAISAALHESGHEVYVANAIEDAAAAHYARGDLPKALSSAREAEAAAVAAGVPLFLAGPLLEQARIHAERGRTSTALALLHEARAIYTELGDHLRAERTSLRIEQLPLSVRVRTAGCTAGSPGWQG
jgi:tetratricopeptide (TPR) repeat protein